MGCIDKLVWLVLAESKFRLIVALAQNETGLSSSTIQIVHLQNAPILSITSLQSMPKCLSISNVTRKRFPVIF